MPIEPVNGYVKFPFVAEVHDDYPNRDLKELVGTYRRTVGTYVWYKADRMRPAINLH